MQNTPFRSRIDSHQYIWKINEKWAPKFCIVKGFITFDMQTRDRGYLLWVWCFLVTNLYLHRVFMTYFTSWVKSWGISIIEKKIKPCNFSVIPYHISFVWYMLLIILIIIIHLFKKRIILFIWKSEWYTSVTFQLIIYSSTWPQ